MDMREHRQPILQSRTTQRGYKSFEASTGIERRLSIRARSSLASLKQQERARKLFRVLLRRGAPAIQELEEAGYSDRTLWRPPRQPSFKRPKSRQNENS